ncbi:unnamed protein product [Closterium sp. NIES-64]|nr:unnamed protein product [Closterium sp. NIES-64]
MNRVKAGRKKAEGGARSLIPCIVFLISAACVILVISYTGANVATKASSAQPGAKNPRGGGESADVMEEGGGEGDDAGEISFVKGGVGAAPFLPDFDLSRPVEHGPKGKRLSKEEQEYVSAEAEYQMRLARRNELTGGKRPEPPFPRWKPGKIKEVFLTPTYPCKRAERLGGTGADGEGGKWVCNIRKLRGGGRRPIVFPCPYPVPPCPCPHAPVLMPLFPCPCSHTPVPMPLFPLTRPCSPSPAPVPPHPPLFPLTRPCSPSPAPVPPHPPLFPLTRPCSPSPAPVPPHPPLFPLTRPCSPSPAPVPPHPPLFPLTRPCFPHGQWVCNIRKLRGGGRRPIVYSAGETSFEQAVRERLRTKAFTFDPFLDDQQAAALRAKHLLRYIPIGLGAGKQLSALRRGAPGKRFATLAQLMGKLNHSHIDVLKIDCERCEERLMEDLLNTFGKENPPAEQILVEIHQIRHVARTTQVLFPLEDMGYRLFNAEANPRFDFLPQLTCHRLFFPFDLAFHWL